MIRTLTALAAAPLLAAAAPSFAQDIYLHEPPLADESLDRMGDVLSDPVRQQELATSLAVVTEILLDLPLAPILDPLAQAAGQATGEPVRRIDPDTTLRRIAPDAGRVSTEIQDKLPSTMQGIGAMSGAVSRMMPALRDMAAQLRAAIPEQPVTDY